MQMQNTLAKLVLVLILNWMTVSSQNVDYE